MRFAVCLLAWATSLAVADDSAPAWRRSSNRSGYAFVTDLELPAADAPGKNHNPAKVVNNASLQDAIGSNDAPPAATPALAPDLYPVDFCDCLVPYLGPCGECECACGETDEYDCLPCEPPFGNCYRLENGTWVCNDRCCDVSCEPSECYDTAVRLGGWGVWANGSPNGVAQFESIQSSPFFDFDGIRSDGVRTLDFSVTGFDDESDNARGRYYSPELSGNVTYQRFLHRLGHEPLAGKNQNDPPLLPSDNVIVDDLNVGEDYAIRVQQLDARFHGQITDNLKWRLNVWWQEKSGERQANAPAHCFDVDPGPATNNVCHVLSQKQMIDWTTVEVQPVLEAKFENSTIEYSRTMRAFGQDDEAVFRQYTRFAPFAGPGNTLGPPFEYAFVPESFTQIDRIKFQWRLDECNQIYSNLFYGDTRNSFRDTNRQYSGYDVRLTNRSIERVTLTGYASVYDENNELPPFLLPEETNPATVLHPIDFLQARAGIKGNWRPGDSYSGLSWAGGYEYYLTSRDYAIYDTALGTFVQPDTNSHMIEVGPSMRWSDEHYSYLRYKARLVDDPLIGVRAANGHFNTNQPEQAHEVEVGHTWTPAPNFALMGQLSTLNSWNHSEFANFSENNYPFVLTCWYAPTDRFCLSGGICLLLQLDRSRYHAGLPLQRGRSDGDNTLELCRREPSDDVQRHLQLDEGFPAEGRLSVGPGNRHLRGAAFPRRSQLVDPTVAVRCRDHYATGECRRRLAAPSACHAVLAVRLQRLERHRSEPG